MKRVACVTGGGDCPGLNAVIRAACTKAWSQGWNCVGIRNGWRGLLDKEVEDLDRQRVDESFYVGGTILGTSRTNPTKEEEGIQRCVRNFKDLELDALIAIGGEDTLGVAALLAAEGLPVVGVPKTIDNDLIGTAMTFGFDTAINIATEAIDRLRTTARSHRRAMVVELMGRHAGWISAFAGIASGADFIALPERRSELADIVSAVQKAFDRGQGYALVAVAEGAAISGVTDMATMSKETDAFGHVRLGGLGQALATSLKEASGHDCRATVLGHIQRGGAPSAMDRVLAHAFGVKAMDLILAGEFGKMAVLSGDGVGSDDLQKVREGIRTLSAPMLELVDQMTIG